MIWIPNVSGLSPRGLGNPDRDDYEEDTDRSIPAWAGEPSNSHNYFLPHGVYPRVGGGTILELCGDDEVMGLSPRGRGNRAWVIS